MKFIWLLVLGILPLNTIFAQFTDQADISAWGMEAVTKLVESDIISGNADGSLKPLANINRAEFLKTLIVATDQPLSNSLGSGFADVPAGAWFAPYVNTAVALGWAKGYPDGSFKPGNPINRAEVSKLLTEAFDLEFTQKSNDQYWFDPYARSLSDLALMPYGVDIAQFSPATEPTRLEIFEQLYRLLRHQGRFAEGDQDGIDTRREKSIVLPEGQTKIEPDQNDEKFLTFTPEPTASQGKLTLESAYSETITASAGETDLPLVTIKIEPSSGNSTIEGFQFRRNGNGDFSDFSLLWIVNGKKTLSAKIVPQSDFVYLELESPLVISRAEYITFMGNISPDAKTSSSRWVSYFPDWINSNAKSTLGLFPLGGSSINIK